MIGSSHPLISVDVARADSAARIRDAEKHAVATEMRRELRAARAEARRARQAAPRHRLLAGGGPIRRLGGLLHPVHARSHTTGYS